MSTIALAAPLRALFRRLASDETAGGAFASMIFVGVGSALAFAMFSLAARVMGPLEFGRFATWFNTLSFLSIVALLGQETLIVRSWNEYVEGRKYGLARGALQFGMLVTSTGVGIAAAAVVVTQWMLGTGIVLAAASALFVAAFAVLQFTSNSGRTIVGIGLGDGHYEITWRLFAVLGLTTVALSGASLTSAQMFALLGSGMVLVIGIQAFAISRNIPLPVRRAKAATDIRSWRSRSAKMWSAAMLDTSSQYLEVIIIGALIDPLMAGGYFVAQRIANAFAKVTLAVSNYAARKIAPLYFGGRHGELHRVTRTLACMTLGLVTAGLTAVFAAGHLLLSIFGDVYLAEFWTLIVLTVGTSFVALAGPSHYMLLHTGHEGTFTRAIATGLVVRLVLLAILAPLYGTLGAAVAWTLATVGVWSTLVLACRKLVGIDPSVLIIARKQPSRQV